MRRPATVLLTAAALALAGTASADAARVGVEGSTVLLRAAPGEQNYVVASFNPTGGPCAYDFVNGTFKRQCVGLVTFRDRAPFTTASPECAPRASAPNVVDCAGTFTGVQASLGDGMDYFYPDGWGGPGGVHDSAAKSRLRYTVDGGADTDWIAGGNLADRLTGGTGGDALFGEGGDDVLDLRDGGDDEGANCGDGTNDVLLLDVVDVINPSACESTTRS
jgi:hypothetical protein